MNQNKCSYGKKAKKKEKDPMRLLFQNNLKAKHKRNCTKKTAIYIIDICTCVI